MTIEELEAIRARDVAVRYCGQCGNRVYSEHEDRHWMTLEQCDESLRTSGRSIDPDTGHYCGDPDAHHPFVEGPIPDYEPAEQDRRALLAYIDGR